MQALTLRRFCLGGLAWAALWGMCHAGEVRYENFFTNPDSWVIGGVNNASPVVVPESNLIRSTSASYTFGQMALEQALTLKTPDDSLEFCYTINVNHSGGPYSSPGMAILTLYGGGTHIISGVNSSTNGRFSATTHTGEPANGYTFVATSGDIRRLTAEVSLNDVIGNQVDTTVHGSISWDEGEQEFAVVFNIAGRSTTPISLGSEVTVSGLGVTFYGPPSAKKSVGSIVLIHRSKAPEPATGLLALVGLIFSTLRRKRTDTPLQK